MSKTAVYIMADGAVNAYKIGISNSPKERNKTLNRDKYSVILYAYVYCFTREQAYAIEQQTHKTFKDCRLQGEWFSLTDEQLSSLINALKEVNPDGFHQEDINLKLLRLKSVCDKEISECLLSTEQELMLLKQKVSDLENTVKDKSSYISRQKDLLRLNRAQLQTARAKVEYYEFWSAGTQAQLIENYRVLQAKYHQLAKEKKELLSKPAKVIIKEVPVLEWIANKLKFS